MIILNEKEFDESVSDGVVLIDFYADWCGPCKMIAPVLEEASKELDDVKFYKVNVDDSPGLAQRFDVMSIPTIVVMKDGMVVSRKTGFMPKLKIIETIDSVR